MRFVGFLTRRAAEQFIGISPSQTESNTSRSHRSGILQPQRELVHGDPGSGIHLRVVMVTVSSMRSWFTRWKRSSTRSSSLIDGRYHPTRLCLLASFRPFGRRACCRPPICQLSSHKTWLSNFLSHESRPHPPILGALAHPSRSPAMPAHIRT